MFPGKPNSIGILRLAALAISAAAAVSALCLPAQTADTSTQVTHLRVTNQVILNGVTRLGINLGEQNFYDSGQMLKNLLARNPDFAPITYRSIFHCQSGGPLRCVDTWPGIRFAPDFWSGATYEVLEGSAAGQRGTITSSSAAAGGYLLTLSSGGNPIGAGDWLVAEKPISGDPAAGWWPTVHGAAHLEAERSDLPPGTPVHQALRIDASGAGQSADLNSYFDSMAGRSFVRLRGRYRLRFLAKSAAGSTSLHVHVGRNAPGLRRYLETDVQLSRAWAGFSLEFDANEDAEPPGMVEAGFSVSGGTVLLDEVDLKQIGDSANQTAFRDEVVETLKELHPGVLRLMESDAGLGSSIDNLLAEPAARIRAGYRVWFKPSDDIPIGIPEFLELCREVGAEPWIVAPTAMSLDGTRKLAQYLAGPATTPGGALRLSQGRREPWTQAFPTIHIELGNETWNGDFEGEAIEDPVAYGRRANAVFAAFRAAARSAAGRFDLVVGTHAFYPDRDAALLAAAPLANTMAIAPYLMRSVTQWGNVDELYSPLLAQSEQMSREGFVAAAAAASGGRQLAVYEVNLHTTAGTVPRDVLDRFTPSAAAGLAVTGYMLRMMRDHAVRDQMLFSLPQFEFRRPDGKTVRLWGSVVQMGADGRKRPQFLAESLANRAIRGDLVRVDVSGENPTHDQLAGNDGVSLRNVHELDAYAFQQGKQHSLIVFNYGLHASRRISVDAPGFSRNSNIILSRIVSSSPGDTNEETVNVKIQDEHFTGSELTLPPCSIAVLQWME